MSGDEQVQDMENKFDDGSCAIVDPEELRRYTLGEIAGLEQEIIILRSKIIKTRMATRQASSDEERKRLESSVTHMEQEQREVETLRNALRQDLETLEENEQ